VTMTCGRARRLLWPDSGPREATAEILAARQHVRGCAPCQRFLDDMPWLSASIREAMPRPEAPAEVRDRVFKAIARARIGNTTDDTARRRRRWVAGLAVALLFVAAWLGLGLPPDSTSLTSDPLGALAEDHLRSQQNTGLASSDSLEVARWLADRLPYAVDVPMFPEARLQGARLLLVNGQSAAVLAYTIAGRPLSYYVLPALHLEQPAGVPQVRGSARAGFHIAAWDDAGLTHALVAALPGPRLIALAHYCIEQMRAAVVA
jgi:hypothetical protein